MEFFMHKSFRHKLVLLVVVALVLVVTTTTVANYLYEEHCVGQVFPSDHTGTEEVSVPYRCFRTQVEAIRYATGGRIDLPDNASREEIDEALMHQ